MSDSLSLYDTLFVAVRKANPHEDPRRQRVFVWAIVGLLLEKTISLTALALVIVSPAKAQSRVRRLRRFLANERVCVRAYYDGLIRQALAAWGEQRLSLVLDATTLSGRLVILRVSLVYRGRAVPIAWQVYERKSVSLPFKAYRAILAHVRTLVPAGTEVVLLGDRGFRTTALMRWCRKQQPLWHFRLRLKANQLVNLADGRVLALGHLGLAPGQVGFLHDVRLGKERYGPIEVAMAWADTPDAEPWFVASDEVAEHQTLADYGLRMDVEQEFRDDKSGGFQLEDSQLADAESVARLLLVMSVACLHLVSLGTWVVESQQRPSVDGHWSRGLSYLQIGWRYLRRAIYLDRAVGSLFRLSAAPDPAPVPLPRARRQRPVWTPWSLPPAEATG
jgi:hypothetical protein